MKRLEALKLIQNKLEQLSGVSSLSRGPVILPDYSIADVILTSLEEIGMLPPPDIIDIRAAEKETGIVYDISYNNPLNDDYSVNFWEKE